MNTNQKKYTVTFLLILGIFASLYFNVNQNKVQVSNVLETEQPLLETEQPLDAVIVSEQSEIKIASLPESASKTALQLIEISNNRLKGKEGWLHVINTVTSDVPTGVFLPDGSEMPSSYIDECWCYIDKKGFLIKYVSTIKSADGTILQQSGYQDGILVNFTFNTREENFPSFEFILDGGAVKALVEAESSGVSIEKKEVKYKDKNHIKLSYSQKYKEALEIAGMPDLVKGLSIELIFSLENGDLIAYSNTVQLIDDQEIFFDGRHLELIEFVDSVPNEILSILESIK